VNARVALAALLLLVAGVQAARAADVGMELGRKVFTETAQPSCKICHTLQAAGAEGKVGPSLDELQPDLEKALQAVRNGSGVMPAFRDKLTAEEIDAVANFVSRAAGRAD
jgi:mono/diheme cytochrome c family protein